MITIPKMIAEPEPIEIDPARSAVIVVDMQNAFVSKGGMFETRGFDIASIQKVIEPIKRICNKARERKVKVIYIAHVLSSDLREVGPESSFWYKSVRAYREDPKKWKDKYLIRGTWGSEIIDLLKPKKGDFLIEKPRFSAFFGTNLDTMLKSYNMKFLFFTGCATNICVEASVRDAANFSYFPVLISDATANNGPPYIQDGTIHNIKVALGWVSNTENFLKAMER
jgi:ureidoacrylate peracid hydrolase